MSSSFFIESSLNQNNCEPESNLVVVYGKNGLNVDRIGLKNLIENKGLSTLSVVRLTSPTPSMKDNDTEDDLEDEIENLSTPEIEDKPKKEDKPEIVGITVEEFFNPEEVKQIAKEILSYTGNLNPIEIKIDYDFQRLAIQNDHCYTPLTSPNQSSNKIQNLNKSAPPKLVRETNSKNKTDTKNILRSFESEINKEQSEEEIDEASEYTESSLSESDNDRDSDLDFDLNDRRNKRRSLNKKLTKSGKKVQKKRISISEKEEEDKKLSVSKAQRYNFDKFSSKPKGNLNIFQEKLSSSSEEKEQKPVTGPELMSEELKHPPLLKKEIRAEGVFTEISTLLDQGGETSKANLKVTQLKSESETDNKPFQHNINSQPGFMQIDVESVMKNQLPIEITPQTLHETPPELTEENDIDLVDSQFVKILEKTEKTVLESSKSSSFAHNHAMDEIDIANAPLLQTSEGLPEDLLKDVVDLMDSTSSILDSQEIFSNTQQFESQSVAAPSEESNQNAITISNTTETPETLTSKPVEIIRKDGRVIKLPPIEAPTTRGAKRRAQSQGSTTLKAVEEPTPKTPVQSAGMSKTAAQRTPIDKNTRKKALTPVAVKVETEQKLGSDSNSDDDPNKLWCICRQPHNNRFMICCDVCEDWFHGTCVNVTKAMGLEMELKGVEWTCPNCLKKDNSCKKLTQKKITELFQKQLEDQTESEKNSDMKTALQMSSKPTARKKSEQKKIETPEENQKSNEDNTIPKTSNASTGEFTSKRSMNLLKQSSDVLIKKNIKSTTVEVEKRVKSTPRKLSDINKKPETENKAVNVSSTSTKILQKQKLNKSTEKYGSSERNQSDLQSKKSDDSPKCIVCKKAARPNSIYCGDDCIRKHAQNALTTATKISKTMEELEEDKKKKNSSFEEALKASETVNKISNKRVYVFERKSGRILTGSNAPTIMNLKKWLHDNPTFEVVLPGTPQAIALERKNLQIKRIGQNSLKSSISGSSTSITSSQTMKPKLIHSIAPQTITVTKDKKVIQVSKPGVSNTPSTISSSNNKSGEDEKDHTKGSQKQLKKQSSLEPKSAAVNNVEPIRLNVKKTLKEQIMARTKEINDPNFPKLTEQEIEEFSNETEQEMFRLFSNDVGAKYKAKYRSLMFNIKDRKNETLFEKICSKKITPKKLVRLTPEEMASQELAQWRQNENKHQLEMIKKSELDLLSCSKNYVLKTHKGEEVIESKEIDQVSVDISTPVEDVVSVLNSSVVSSTSEMGKSSEKNENKSSNDSNLDQSLTKSSKNIKKSSSLSTTTSSSASSKKKHKEKEKEKDRRHRSRERHKHRKHSRSKSRSRGRDHKSDRARSRDHHKKEKDSKEKLTSKETSSSKEKYEKKEKEKQQESKHKEKLLDSKDKIENLMTKNKEKDKSQIKSNNLNRKVDHHVSNEGKKDSKEIKSQQKSPKPEDFNLIDKILESAKSVEEAANLVKEEEKIKKKEKDNQKQKESKKEPDKFKQSASKFDNSSAVDSDQEPTSTVTIASPPQDPYLKYSNDLSSTIWNGAINMVEVATFQITVQTFKSSNKDIGKELPTELDVVGRISPDTVWDYILKIRKSPNKEIVLLRIIPFNESENHAYLSLLTYLEKRKRLGVVKTTSPVLKDFYIMPLGSKKAIPSVLQTNVIDFEFFHEDTRPDVLLGIVIKIIGKRPNVPTVPNVLPPKVRKMNDPTVISKVIDEQRFTPPSSPRKVTETNTLLSGKFLPLDSTESEIYNVEKVIASSTLLKGSNNEGDEPYSPGGSSEDDTFTADTNDPEELKRKMEEINRQIKAQEMEIAGMLNRDQTKGYLNVSSVDLTPALANISIPSNLHQILASIKQTAPPTDSFVPLPSSSTTILPSSDSYPSPSEIIVQPPPPPPLHNSSEVEEYIPEPPPSPPLKRTAEEVDMSEDKLFSNDVNSQTEFTPASKKTRWDKIQNPPPPGLEDEYP